MSKRNIKEKIPSVGCIVIIATFYLFCFFIVHKTNVRQKEKERKETLVMEERTKQYNEKKLEAERDDRIADYERICNEGEDRWGSFEKYFSYTQYVKRNLLAQVQYLCVNDILFEEDSNLSSEIKWDLCYCSWIYYRLSVACLYQGDFDEFVESLNDPSAFNSYFERAKSIGLVDTYKFFLKNIIEEDDCYDKEIYEEDIEYSY